MFSLLLFLSPLWFGLSGSSRLQMPAASDSCTLEAWLTRHPADSALHLVPGDSLDHAILPLGPHGPSTPPPAEALTGIGADVVVGVVLDTLGNAESADVCTEHVTRYQGGIAPDEVRRLAPKFDDAALVLVRREAFTVPKHKLHKVNAFASMTVRFTPIPVGNAFQVSVSIVP